jgi:hypothetical protein
MLHCVFRTSRNDKKVEGAWVCMRGGHGTYSVDLIGAPSRMQQAAHLRPLGRRFSLRPFRWMPWLAVSAVCS